MKAIYLLVLTLFVSSKTFAAIVVAGNDSIVSSSSSTWSWDGTQHQELRDALEDTNNFGNSGIVGHDVELRSLGSNITASSLQDVDIFVASYWFDSQAAIYSSVLVDYFLAGGDLIILQDSAAYDGMGEALGIATSAVTTNPTTVSSASLLGDGPFGTVAPINQIGTIGHLDTAAITSRNGTVCGTDAAGRATIACWQDGEYAANAGSLTIFADVDLISGVYGEADFSPTNDKGRLALNTFAFHMSEVNTVNTPPALCLLILSSLYMIRRKLFIA